MVMNFPPPVPPTSSGQDLLHSLCLLSERRGREHGLSSVSLRVLWESVAGVCILHGWPPCSLHGHHMGTDWPLCHPKTVKLDHEAMGNPSIRSLEGAEGLIHGPSSFFFLPHLSSHTDDVPGVSIDCHRSWGPQVVVI